jgi:hypothetical protein
MLEMFPLFREKYVPQEIRALRVGFGLLISLSLLGGCSRKVEGEAFITGPKGDSEKLSLVRIWAMDEQSLNEFKNFIQQREKNLQNELSAAVSKVDVQALEVQVARQLAIEPKSLASIRSCINTRGHLSSCFDIVDRVSKEASKADDDAREAAVQATRSIESLANFPSNQIGLFANAAIDFASGKGVQFIKTDSDGKYSINLPSGHRYIIGVPESQQLRGKYFWLIDTKNVNDKLTLSNDNIIQSSCSECTKLEVSPATNALIEQAVGLRYCFNSQKNWTQYGCKLPDFAAKIKKVSGTKPL